METASTSETSVNLLHGAKTQKTAVFEKYVIQEMVGRDWTVWRENRYSIIKGRKKDHCQITKTKAISQNILCAMS
jgi:hypothetical protein